jgi:hypothetical protein
MGVRVQIAADKGWRFSGALHEMRIVIVRDSQKGNFYQFSVSKVASGALLTSSGYHHSGFSACCSSEPSLIYCRFPL